MTSFYSPPLMSCLLYSQRQACCAVPPHWLFFFLFLFDRSDELVLWEEPLLISHDDAVGQRLYKPLMITTHLLRPSKTLKRIIQTISSPQDCMDRESPPPPTPPTSGRKQEKKMLYLYLYILRTRPSFPLNLPPAPLSFIYMS